MDKKKLRWNLLPLLVLNAGLVLWALTGFTNEMPAILVPIGCLLASKVLLTAFRVQGRLAMLPENEEIHDISWSTLEQADINSLSWTISGDTDITDN